MVIFSASPTHPYLEITAREPLSVRHTNCLSDYGGNDMKKLVIGLLLVSGFAMAGDVEGNVKPQKRMASWTKLALNTQSPRVKLSKLDNYQAPKEGYRIVSSKDTINAYIPYG